MDIDLFGHVPAEVENPPPAILTERARFAGPHSVVFPATIFQPPRNRVKEQAVKNRLPFFLPTHKNLTSYSLFNVFFQIS